jgi:hypothetical protein
MVGSRQSGAQYGSAVSGLDDINKDGYNGEDFCCCLVFLSTGS